MSGRAHHVRLGLPDWPEAFAREGFTSSQGQSCISRAPASRRSFTAVPGVFPVSSAAERVAGAGLRSGACGPSIGLGEPWRGFRDRACLTLGCRCVAPAAASSAAVRCRLRVEEPSPPPLPGVRGSARRRRRRVLLSPLRTDICPDSGREGPELLGSYPLISQQLASWRQVAPSPGAQICKNFPRARSARSGTLAVYLGPARG